MDKSLVYIAYKLIIFEYFVQSLNFDIANSINNDGMSCLVSATDAMLINRFDAINFRLVYKILHDMCVTSYSFLKWR